MRTAIWLVTLGIIAAITVLAQVDRQSRISPELARYLPPAFASFALQQQTAKELVERDPAAATMTARTLVARRPMPAENLRMLAQARAIAGAEEQAASAILQAARRGWRDIATQRAMLELALAAGNQREAARRLAALWALNQDRETLGPVANRVLLQEEAQAEMARLLEAAPRWQDAFERVAPDLVDPAILRAIEQRRQTQE